MATRHYKGSARFEYTPVGGVLTQHRLAAPLLDFEIGEDITVFSWWAEDRRTREVVTVGTGAPEFVASIRFDNQPNALREMLVAAVRDDVTLTYYPDADAPGIPLKVVEVAGAPAGMVRLERDPDRFMFNEWMARVRFRRVDGGDLSDLFTDEAA